jgi:phosphinothricin acetyltransferase
LFAELESEDVHLAVAGITVPNAASVALHKSLGFVHVGCFHAVGRKNGRFWDVDWFERPL